MAEKQQMQGGRSSSSPGNGEGGRLELPWKAYAHVEAEHHNNGYTFKLKKKINGYGECIPVMVMVSGVRDNTKRGKDVVVVLHLRRDFNAPKNWRELLKQAMDTIAASLDKQDDRLAVIPGASTLTPALRFLPPQIENFSPAMDSSLVRALEQAESILLGREKMRRAGHIIVISNSNDDTDMGNLVPYRHRYVRHAFGFRDAHNARTMQSLCSSIRNCTYAVLDDEQGHIAPAFFASIHRTIASTEAAMPTEVKLKCEQKVLVAAIDTPGVRHFISYDKKVGLVWPPAHLAAEPFKFVVYLANLPWLRSISDDDLHRLFSVQAKYTSSPPVFHKVAVQVVSSKNRYVRESKEVAAEMVRAEAVKMVADILAQDQTDWNWEQLHVAADSLRRKWEQHQRTYTEAAGDDDGLLLSGLSADIYEMEIRLHNNYLWQEYMLSWHSHQRWQLPLEQPFMDRQPTRNHAALLVVDPIVVASSPAVLVRVIAPEVCLAMVKRGLLDLVVVVDAGYGAKEMEEKLDERLKLLMTTKELEEQRRKFQANLDLLRNMIPHSREGLNEVDFERLRSIIQKTAELNNLVQQFKATRAKVKQMDDEFERVRYNTERRLDLITKAVELVQKKLSVKDRLAIICAQSPDDTEPAAACLLEMSTRGQRQTTDKLQNLRQKLKLSEASWKIPAENKPKLSKAWHCREQSKKAMKLMRTCLNRTLNSSTPIPTSAQCQDTASMTVNSGDAGRSTLLSKALIQAVKILDERREQEDQRMGFIIVVSDRDDDSICGETLSRKYITHAFGFHETHNMWAMYHIASSCNGIYDILNDERSNNKLTEAFMACINKITSTIAVDTKIDIKCSHSSVVSSAIESSSSGRFTGSSSSINNSGKSCSIQAGALSAGTVADFIIDMDQVCEDDELFTVHVEWLHPLGRMKEKLKDKVVVVRKQGVGIKGGEGIIAESIARVKAVKIVNEIAGPLYQDRMMVEAYLKKMCVECSTVAKDAGEDRLARAMKLMADALNMETENFRYFKQLVAQTLSCMLSWLSYHRSSQQAP